MQSYETVEEASRTGMPGRATGGRAACYSGLCNGTAQLYEIKWENSPAGTENLANLIPYNPVVHEISKDLKLLNK
jgi:hypothetical protein